MAVNFGISHENDIDFLYYNLPRQPENLTRYNFPSMCIGYEGLFKAFQFLRQYKDNKDSSLKHD
jgi:hypothetical protein